MQPAKRFSDGMNMLKKDGELSDEELEQVVGGSKDMKYLFENWRDHLDEKELRGDKKKRMLYHIGKRPARPVKKMKWFEDWDDMKQDFVKVEPDHEWKRYWLKQPVESGVFLSPNPMGIALNHGVGGHVYAYKIPEWIIKEAGGIHRFDWGSEILIPEELWDEAGDEIEFLGKSMDEQEVQKKIVKMYSDRFRKFAPGSAPPDVGEPPWVDENQGPLDEFVAKRWRSFLKEDIDTRETFARDLCKMGGYDRMRNPVMDDDYPEVIKTGRGIKKAYNKYVDRAFLDSLITIHWTDRMGSARLLKGSSKDELSCAAYLPGEVTASTWGDYGFVVDGHITLLANDMNDVMSGAGVDYTLANPERTKSSGANKGVGISYRCVDYVDKIFVFDEEDWKPRIVKDSNWNEAFVDNWKITAIIAPEISHNYLQKIVHGRMNRPDVKIISPEQVGEL